MKANFEGEKGPTQDKTRHVRLSIYSKPLSREQDRYSVDVIDGVHIGVTW